MIRRSTKGDTVDLDALTALAASRAWAMLTARLTTELDRSIQELNTVDTWEQALRAQGRIAGLRLALHAPAILIGETREKLKDQRKNHVENRNQAES